MSAEHEEMIVVGPVPDRVWKFEIPLEATEFDIEMPEGAALLHLAVQGGQPCLWAMVDPEADLERRAFVIVGTGIATSLGPERYVGTWHQRALDGTDYVFHLFEGAPPDG